VDEIIGTGGWGWVNAIHGGGEDIRGDNLFTVLPSVPRHHSFTHISGTTE